MKALIISIIFLLSLNTIGQNDSSKTNRNTLVLVRPNAKNFGNLFIHWGYNRAWYSTSDIHFKGNGYNFTLVDAVAKDRPTVFNWGQYFALQNLTIPQTNFKIGYFISDKWSLSFGVDHMKYVLEKSRYTTISGTINNNSVYDGTYKNDAIYLANNFIHYEHTDGLNYVNLEGDYFIPLVSWKNKIILQTNFGGGAGFLLPKTRAVLFKQSYRDNYNIAGYGFNGKIGLDLKFWNFFFLHTDLKGGFINMPNVRITDDSNEGAKQHFWFTEFNWLFGLNYALSKKKSKQ